MLKYSLTFLFFRTNILQPFLNIMIDYILEMKLNTYTPKADFNGMDCTDLVIGSARGSASRVWDYYTRDR